MNTSENILPDPDEWMASLKPEFDEDKRKVYYN
jgi:hypothetical protein